MKKLIIFNRLLEFVFITPLLLSPGAGKLTVVFAWLITPDGQNHGIHVFAVRLRDDEGKCMPGVRIADNGTKMGVRASLTP